MLKLDRHKLINKILDDRNVLNMGDRTKVRQALNDAFNYGWKSGYERANERNSMTIDQLIHHWCMCDGNCRSEAGYCINYVDAEKIAHHFLLLFKEKKPSIKLSELSNYTQETQDDE